MSKKPETTETVSTVSDALSVLELALTVNTRLRQKAGLPEASVELWRWGRDYATVALRLGLTDAECEALVHEYARHHHEQNVAVVSAGFFRTGIIDVDLQLTRAHLGEDTGQAQADRYEVDVIFVVGAKQVHKKTSRKQLLRKLFVRSSQTVIEL